MLVFHLTVKTSRGSRGVIRALPIHLLHISASQLIAELVAAAGNSKFCSPKRISGWSAVALNVWNEACMFARVFDAHLDHATHMCWCSSGVFLWADFVNRAAAGYSFHTTLCYGLVQVENSWRANVVNALDVCGYHSLLWAGVLNATVLQSGWSRVANNSPSRRHDSP